MLSVSKVNDLQQKQHFKLQLVNSEIEEMVDTRLKNFYSNLVHPNMSVKSEIDELIDFKKEVQGGQKALRMKL
jgi:hypothetical protein